MQLQVELVQPLSNDEAAAYERCVSTLDKNQEGFIESIRAMKEIRDRRLYRGTHTDFESWLADRHLKIGKNELRTRQRADQLIHHLMVVDTLSQQPMVDTLPANERQTRELYRIEDPSEMTAVWLGAQQASGKEQPGQSWIESTAEAMGELKSQQAVDVGDGKQSLGTAYNFARSTAKNELERVQRMIDHIRENRKRKPLAVFEGRFESKQDDPVRMTLLGDMNDETWKKIAIGKKVRLVVYEIVEQPA